MKTFFITDKGRTRDMNQDYMFVSETPVGNLPNLFIVADGMGGHNAGDYASRYAVEIMVRRIHACEKKEPAAVFEHAITAANQELLLRSREESELAGMGTTAVLACIEGSRLTVANVGDSRLYVMNEKITQITRDHSLVEEMVRMGELEVAEAREHPDRNIITRAIGATEEVVADVFEAELKEQDTVLLCTDGLNNMLTDEEILKIMNSGGELADRVTRLIEQANESGGKDNVTAIGIESY